MTNEQILELIKEIEKRKADMQKLSTASLKAMEKAAKVSKSQEIKFMHEEARKSHEKDMERMDQMVEELRQKLNK